MRKFRVEINGKIHEVKIEEIKEEMEVQIAVIAAAISAYLESEEVPKVIPKAPLIKSKWSLAGRHDLMAPLERDRKMLAKTASRWSLAGRQELMRGISNEEI